MYKRVIKCVINVSSANHCILLSECLLFDFQSGALCIHEAARKGHVGLLKMLLEKGVPVNTKNKVHTTVFVNICLETSRRPVHRLWEMV